MDEQTREEINAKFREINARIYRRPQNMSVQIVLAILAIIFLSIAGFSAYRTANYDKYVEDWKTNSAALTAYKSTVKHYNEQKQLVIDTYNNQIDIIAKNGLKSQDYFDGIHFKTNVFKKNMQNDNDESINNISTKPDFAIIAEEMYNKANHKIENLRKYYNGKISTVYEDLKKNSNKVSFSSLKEYGDGPEQAQFTHDDFNDVGKKCAVVYDMNYLPITIAIPVILGIICLGLIKLYRSLIGL